MSKGTASKGKRGLGRAHIRCPRCGNPSFHKTKKKCAKCGYGKSRRIRWYAWQKKNKSKWKFKKKKR